MGSRTLNKERVIIMNPTSPFGISLTHSYLTDFPRGYAPKMIPLTDITLTRVMTKHAQRGYLVISAYRNDESQFEPGVWEKLNAMEPSRKAAEVRKINKEATSELEIDLESAGFASYLKVRGGWYYTKGDTEASTGNFGKGHSSFDEPGKEYSYEDSFLVMPRSESTSFDKIVDFVIGLANKYRQLDVLVVPPGGQGYWLSGTWNGKNLKDEIPNRTVPKADAAFDTKLNVGNDNRKAGSGFEPETPLNTDDPKTTLHQYFTQLKHGSRRTGHEGKPRQTSQDFMLMTEFCANNSQWKLMIMDHNLATETYDPFHMVSREQVEKAK